MAPRVEDKDKAKRPGGSLAPKPKPAYVPTGRPRGRPKARKKTSVAAGGTTKPSVPGQNVCARWDIEDLDHVFQNRPDLTPSAWWHKSIVCLEEISRHISRSEAEKLFAQVVDSRIQQQQHRSETSIHRKFSTLDAAAAMKALNFQEVRPGIFSKISPEEPETDMNNANGQCDADGQVTTEERTVGGGTSWIDVDGNEEQPVEDEPMGEAGALQGAVCDLGEIEEPNEVDDESEQDGDGQDQEIGGEPAGEEAAGGACAVEERDVIEVDGESGDEMDVDEDAVGEYQTESAAADDEIEEPVATNDEMDVGPTLAEENRQQSRVQTILEQPESRNTPQPAKRVEILEILLPIIRTPAGSKTKGQDPTSSTSSMRPESSGGVTKSTPAKDSAGATSTGEDTARGRGRWAGGTKTSDYGADDSTPGLPAGRATKGSFPQRSPQMARREMEHKKRDYGDGASRPELDGNGETTAEVAADLNAVKDANAVGGSYEINQGSVNVNAEQSVKQGPAQIRAPNRYPARDRNSVVETLDIAQLTGIVRRHEEEPSGKPSNTTVHGERARGGVGDESRGSEHTNELHWRPGVRHESQESKQFKELSWFICRKWEINSPREVFQRRRDLEPICWTVGLLEFLWEIAQRISRPVAEDKIAAAIDARVAEAERGIAAGMPVSNRRLPRRLRAGDCSVILRSLGLGGQASGHQMSNGRPSQMATGSSHNQAVGIPIQTANWWRPNTMPISSRAPISQNAATQRPFAPTLPVNYNQANPGGPPIRPDASTTRPLAPVSRTNYNQANSGGGTFQQLSRQPSEPHGIDETAKCFVEAGRVFILMKHRTRELEEARKRHQVSLTALAHQRNQVEICRRYLDTTLDDKRRHTDRADLIVDQLDRLAAFTGQDLHIAEDGLPRGPFLSHNFSHPYDPPHQRLERDLMEVFEQREQAEKMSTSATFLVREAQRREEELETEEMKCCAAVASASWAVRELKAQITELMRKLPRQLGLFEDVLQTYQRQFHECEQEDFDPEDPVADRSSLSFLTLWSKG